MLAWKFGWRNVERSYWLIYLFLAFKHMNTCRTSVLMFRMLFSYNSEAGVQRKVVECRLAEEILASETGGKGQILSD